MDSLQVYFLFQEYNKEPDNNYIDPNGNNFTLSVLNSAIRTSNLNLAGTNTVIWIRSSYDAANAAFLTSNTSYDKANSANIVASAAYDKANTTNTYATSAYNLANTNSGDITIIQGVNTNQNGIFMECFMVTLMTDVTI